MRGHLRTPEWSHWNRTGPEWTVGVEEEVMLLDPLTWMPASRSEEVLASLDAELAAHASAETHGSAIELATSPHERVGDAIDELARLRARLAHELERLGLAGAVAGTHPLATWEDTEVSPGARYQFLYSSLRELARREPTFALHVHVGIPDPVSAVRALNGVREHLPLLLALSANSPFWQGRDSGLASARTPVFQAFPRTGSPRYFGDYAAYVEAIDVLLRCDAIPEPTFLWWDARLQPALGTLEVRVMDAQTRVRDTGALVALVQAMVRREALERDDAWPPTLPEVLGENRFLAARDGMRAAFVSPEEGRCVPVTEHLALVLHDVAPHARELGSAPELASIHRLAAHPGDTRQRAIAARPQGLRGVLRALHGDFVAPRADAVLRA
jgi:glutamate---cysteine ligase / carboxylate-amine ligase